MDESENENENGYGIDRICYGIDRNCYWISFTELGFASVAGMWMRARMRTRTGMGLIGFVMGLMGMKRRIVAGPTVRDMYGISFTELGKGWD